MAEAGRLDYTVDRGGQLEDVLTWYTDESRNEAVDLSGYTATLRVSTGSRTEPVIEKGLSTGENGTVFVHLTDEETAALDEPVYLFDIQLESGEGLRSYLVQGLLTVMGRL